MKLTPDCRFIWQHSHMAHGRGHESEALLLAGLEVLHADHVLSGQDFATKGHDFARGGFFI